MHTIHLANPSAVQHAVHLITDPGYINWYMKLVQSPQRSLEQNALMWPYLQQFAEQLDWPLWTPQGWRPSHMSAEEWKDFLTACFKRETATIAQGMDRWGYVMVGTRTSDMDKKQFADFLTFMQAFAAQQNVDLERNLKKLARNGHDFGYR